MVARSARFVLAALVLVAGVVMVGAPDASAATIAVNTTLDSDAHDGSCSLREAIDAANNDAPSGFVLGECPAGSGADTIELPAGTYTLSSPLPDISTDVRFVGAGAPLTVIDGNGNSSVLRSVGGVELTIDRLTLTGGAAFTGGGIDSSGSLTVTESTITGNSATFGGGIIADGISIINYSTVSGNTADVGGGVYHSGGPSVVANSTISGNMATDHGGGLYNNFATTTVVFSTITNNAASAGAGISSFADGSVATEVSASIVADNHGGGSDVDLFSGSIDSFFSGSFNVIGTTGANVTEFGVGSNDLVGQSNLGLGPLSLNGGPTGTHALMDGSMAIDRVTGLITLGTDQAVDQRGTTRPQGPNKDTGAFEAIGSSPAQCAGLLATINLNTNGGSGVGTAGADVIVGTSGADDINAAAGDDTVCGGAGDDLIRGGPGSDTILGDDGNDTLRGGGAADTIRGGPGDDRIFGQGGPDDLDGGGGDDRIDGMGAADTINGGAGHDTMNGQNGADAMTGASGADTIRGQTGPDTIDGDGGNDDLFGGEGADTLTGGPGTDKCAGNTGPDQAHAASCEATPGVETLF